MIRCSEAIRGTPRPEKTDRFCEEPVGVRDCESSDRIKGCDGTCIRAVDSLAGVGGWSITNVTAFTISSCQRSAIGTQPKTHPSALTFHHLIFLFQSTAPPCLIHLQHEVCCGIGCDSFRPVVIPSQIPWLRSLGFRVWRPGTPLFCLCVTQPTVSFHTHATSQPSQL